MRQKIREQLLECADTDYKSFNGKLLPGVSDILGVRLPRLRQIAKQAAAQDAQLYLAQMHAADWKADVYYEEKILYGLVIGYAKMTDNEYSRQLDTFVPRIDNWGVCDSCCATYKWMRKHPAYWWDYLNRWISTDTEFSIRFGVVAMLDHFVDEAYIQDILAVCNQIHNEGYYAKMGTAWLVSVCFVKYPEETYAFLQDDQMDDFTHNKAIQKICESYRAAREQKELCKELIRK